MVYLMYHELEARGRAPCHAGAGYLRYVIAEEDFRSQLSALADGGFHGWSVTEGLSLSRAGNGVVITFDDGCETDLSVAAPLLKAAGFQATFYVVPGFFGRRGYLSAGQVRELCALGFEIGCHSMTHLYLSSLAPAELHREVVESKARLEQMIGQPVSHFSCPGGRWNRVVARTAAQAGYSSVATSRVGRNGPEADVLRLNRVAVLRAFSADKLVRIASGQGLTRMRFSQGLRSALQRAVGDAAYDRLRARLLGKAN